MANEPKIPDGTRGADTTGTGASSTNAGFGGGSSAGAGYAGSRGTGGTDSSNDINSPLIGGSSTGLGTGGVSASTSRSGSQGEQGARIEGQEQDENASGPGPRLMTASILEGDKVVNRLGEDLGEIDEIMLDVPRGRIAYAVMSSGGFLGMGEKLFAIPWGALTLDTDNKCFVLDVDKQRMQDAPGFDKDNWPSMPDTEFDTRVHSYYGTRPYWE